MVNIMKREQFEARNPDLKFVGLDRDKLGLWYRGKDGRPVFFDGGKFGFFALRFYEIVTEKFGGKEPILVGD